MGPGVLVVVVVAVSAVQLRPLEGTGSMVAGCERAAAVDVKGRYSGGNSGGGVRWT